MSLGYGWHADLYSCDETCALYAYHTYDLNLPSGKNGYGIKENDGSFWVFIGPNHELEFQLEKISKYCSGKGLHSAEHLYYRCTRSITSNYQETGSFPLQVSGNI